MVSFKKTSGKSLPAASSPAQRETTEQFSSASFSSGRSKFKDNEPSAYDRRLCRNFERLTTLARQHFHGIFVIDGGGGTGKTDIGGRLAAALNAPFLDTGVLFRIGTLYVMLREKQLNGGELGTQIRQLQRAVQSGAPISVVKESVREILSEQHNFGRYAQTALESLLRLSNELKQQSIPIKRVSTWLERANGILVRSHRGYRAAQFIRHLSISVASRSEDQALELRDYRQLSFKGAHPQEEMAALSRLLANKKLSQLKVEVLQQQVTSGDVACTVNKVAINAVEITQFISSKNRQLEAEISHISKNPYVRRACKRKERQFAGAALLAKSPGVVLVGRDLQTKVFPRAEYKFFLEGSPKDAAARRAKALLAQGFTKVNFDAILRELIRRDHFDRNRRSASLRQAFDAHAITNDLSRTLKGITAELLYHIAKKS